MAAVGGLDTLATMKADSNPLVHSKLTHTILKINPGVDKQAQAQHAKLARLMKKSSKTAEFHRKSVKNNFEARREQRKKLYDRLRPNLDETTRGKIDKIKEKDRKKEAERQKRKEQKAEDKAQKLEGVKQRVGAKRGGVPQLPVPRPAHVLKQQQKDGWKEEDEFAEVDVYGKELFVKSSKQALPKGFGC